MMQTSELEGVEDGDKLTIDGLRFYKVVDANATWGLGGTREGFELKCVSHDEEGTIRKTDREIRFHWRKAN